MKPLTDPGRCGAALLWLLLAGCASHPAIQESESLLAAGRPDEGVARLESAMGEAPNDRELRAAYFRQRDQASARLVAEAETRRLEGDPAQARALFLRAQRIDPNNPRVRDGLIALDNEVRVANRMAEARQQIERKQNDAAERTLREVLRSAPGHAEARRLQIGRAHV